MFPVKPSAGTVDCPNRDGKLKGYLLRIHPTVKKVDYLKIVRLPPVDHFCAPRHFLHSTSTINDPIGDFLRRMKK